VVDEMTAQALEASEAWWSALYQEVSGEEGTLAGGERHGPGTDALLGLKETEVRFGNPRNRLTQLTPALFAALNVTLDPILEEQLGGAFDFYYLTITASLFPRRGAQFDLVECRLTFPEETAIIQTIFPEARWRRVVEWGGSARLALNGKFDWELGLPSDALRELSGAEAIPAANLKNANELSSFITVPSYSFDIGRPEITAVGVGDSQARWRLQTPDLRGGKSVEFVLVFKVPADTEAVMLEGAVVAEPRMAWLTAQLADVFGELSARLKSFLSKPDAERQGGERMPIGMTERWPLDLPRRQDEEEGQ
jgi:hypothetical protein